MPIKRWIYSVIEIFVAIRSFNAILISGIVFMVGFSAHILAIWPSFPHFQNFTAFSCGRVTLKTYGPIFSETSFIIVMKVLCSVVATLRGVYMGLDIFSFQIPLISLMFEMRCLCSLSSSTFTGTRNITLVYSKSLSTVTTTLFPKALWLQLSALKRSCPELNKTNNAPFWRKKALFSLGYTAFTASDRRNLSRKRGEFSTFLSLMAGSRLRVNLHIFATYKSQLVFFLFPETSSFDWKTFLYLKYVWREFFQPSILRSFFIKKKNLWDGNYFFWVFYFT